MSESGDHRILVHALAREISGDAIWTKPPIIYCDVQEGAIAVGAPQIIGSSRPDVFARDIGASLSVIGEAKTSKDIDNRHTFDQLESFFSYLREQPKAEVWMGVPWLSAGTATRVCVHARRKSDAIHVRIRVVAYMIGNTSQRRVWFE
ncbi:MAG: hypothetical protein IPJ25_11075 [Rhodocyclaceae bacterium]|nr:hypothetical protein [Rhodocyclaceae bacterium]